MLRSAQRSAASGGTSSCGRGSSVGEIAPSDLPHTNVKLTLPLGESARWLSYLSALYPKETLRSALQLLGDELAHAGPGASAVLDHIVHIMLIQLLRVWLESRREAEHPPSWLGGLTDPVTSAALTAIHRDPAHPWTVETLARSAGVSRATLVRRFSTEVGCPPAEYLTKWRMELAANKLRLTALPVARIARDVGYISEYAFNRTFARWHGAPPGRYRTAFLAAESDVSASAVSDLASSDMNPAP